MHHVTWRALCVRPQLRAEHGTRALERAKVRAWLAGWEQWWHGNGNDEDGEDDHVWVSIDQGGGKRRGGGGGGGVGGKKEKGAGRGKRSRTPVA